MDQAKDEDYIFNLKLAKITGLYQILDSKTTKAYGYNVYHIVIMIMGLSAFTLSIINLLGLNHLTNDLTAFMYYLGVFINFLLAYYKISNILYHSNDLWKCMFDITCCNFLSYQHYNKNVFKKWRSLTILVLYIYSIIISVVVVFWIVYPCLMKNLVITVRNHDGSYSKHRINIFNSFYMVPDNIYNNHFSIFFILDIILDTSYDYFLTIFDYVIILMCFAFSSQLETISDGIESIGYECSQNNLNINNMRQMKCDVFDDLKMILTDHQKVMKKLNDYYTLIGSSVLTQICVSSYTHIFIWYIVVSSFSGNSNGDSVLTMKLLVALPYFGFQLIMICYLFGKIKEKKDVIIFALYSSSWTEMDMKSKKLVLFAMTMNNSIQPKLMFTWTKIVNLEMFTSTMRVCYSLFSMLLKSYN